MLTPVKSLLIFLLLFFTVINLQSEIRYISKYGSSTVPYTSWETACDSLQKCFQYCMTNDTVYVDRGVYRETIYLQNKNITVIGLDTDECIIDGTGVDGLDYKSVLCRFKNCLIELNNITFKKKRVNGEIYSYAVFTTDGNCCINNCKIDSTYSGISINDGGSVNNTILKRVNEGIHLDGYSMTTLYHFNVKNNILFIVPEESDSKGIYFHSGTCNIYNNIISIPVHENNDTGIEVEGNDKISIKNNLVYGFGNAVIATSYYGSPTDTTFIVNNTFLNSIRSAVVTGNMPKLFIIKNNILAHNGKGLYSYGNQGKLDYNMFYENHGVLYTNLPAGAHDIVADPMFVNDVLPTYGGDYNFRLQMYSPAIDRGDPNILDVDGSRSDLGMFGGPLGEAYSYMNLAPKPVQNLKAVYEQDISRVKLTWKNNTESDLKRYNIYKDINQNFVIDSTKRIGTINDTLFYDIMNKGTLKIYYKLTAVDNSDNESECSTELNVTITENEEVDITENMEYGLYQNYPNPFNPSTTISYNLKNQGEVRIKLYTITGELISTIIEGTKNKGYSETKIDMGGYTSGIYLYRIEVTGAGKIPVFNDLKKMIYLK
ncbi:MAG: T9SS type A sorting domain-containing protein [bacterium]